MLPISFLCLFLPSPSSPLDPPAHEASVPFPEGHVTLVRAERLILRPGEELENASLLIEDGRIVEIGTDVQAPEGARVLTGSVACAGFVDSWSSLGLDTGSLLDLQTTPGARTADAIDPWYRPHIIAEALRGGVTSARVQAGMKAPMSGVGSVVQFGSDGSHVLLDDACVGATVGVTRSRPSDVFDRIAEVDRLGGLIEKGRAYREAQIEYKHELAEWEKEIADK